MEPKIRLKGFSGEWGKNTVESVCDISTGKSNTQDKVEDGKYPFYVRSSIVERSNKFLYDEEAVLTAGDGVGTGKVFHYVNGKYDLHQRCYRMFNFRNINSKYFYYLFSTKFYNRVMSMTAKSSVDSVRYDMIADMEIKVPLDIAEQKAIASYFQHLDSLIQSTTKKIESLKQVKAASLQSMFPQEGETTPRVRFKGFEEEWISVKLSHIASFSKGQGYSKSDLIEKGTPIILYGRLYTKYAFSINHVDTFVNYKEGTVLSEGNEVIIPASGETPEDIARASAVMSKGIILGGDLNIVKVDENVCLPEFLALSITYGSLHHILSKYAQGKTVVHLHNAEIKNISIYLPPTIAEQKDIVDYFKSIDNQISLQTKRLEKLKQIKSACLDMMFV